MSKTITLSGWGQPANALEVIAPGAEHISYGGLFGFEGVSDLVAGKEVDQVIGWSLGGQIALRLIAAGALKAKQLVLLGTPFQFVRSAEIGCGVSSSMMMEFRQGFLADPEPFLARFAQFIVRGDDKEKTLLPALKAQENTAKCWLYWLDELAHFSCCSLDFSAMPRTLLVHGRNDDVVDVNHTGLFASLLPDNHVEIIDGCSHAPHLHDAPQVKKWIEEHAADR